MLTPRQHQALIFIDSFIKEKGYAPSYEQIGEGLETTRSGAWYLAERLAARGAIAWTKGVYRSIRILTPPILPASSGCPLFRVAA